jgi:PKD repeat protein
MRIKLLILLSLILLVGVVSADTSVIYAESNWATIRSVLPPSTFLQLRDGVGTGFDNLAATNNNYQGLTQAGLLSPNFTYHARGILIYNTPMPASATINSVIASNYYSAKFQTLGTPNASIIEVYPASKTSIVAADYKRTTFQRYANDVLYASITTGAYNNIQLTNLSAITKEGRTALMFTTSVDVDNTSYSYSTSGYSGFQFRSLYYSSGTAKPYITIEWTPDTTPPASITNLSNNTALCSEVTWTWDNPTDTDYAYLHVLKNNVWTGNYSNSTSSATWLTLNELTSYTFSSRTVDLDGNMNTTWVNRTVTTPVCPATPITSFTSNVTCGNLPTVAVQFNDTSFDNGYAITGYNWTFGDGNTSTLQNPVNTYYAAGAYWVNHSAGNIAGATWSNVSRYMIVVPDWGTCTPVSSGNTYFISNSQETPVAIVIPVLAILLLALYVRRK